MSDSSRDMLQITMIFGVFEHVADFRDATTQCHDANALKFVRPPQTPQCGRYFMVARAGAVAGAWLGGRALLMVGQQARRGHRRKASEVLRKEGQTKRVGTKPPEKTPYEDPLCPTEDPNIRSKISPRFRHDTLSNSLGMV